MSNAPENNEEFQDRDFERAVYQAMKSCGWLVPKTPEELRRAEAKLAMNPIEIPESLRDPFRILDAPEFLRVAFGIGHKCGFAINVPAVDAVGGTRRA